MEPTTRLAVVFAVILTVSAAIAPAERSVSKPAAAGDYDPSPRRAFPRGGPSLVVRNGTPEQRTLLDWAVGRFQEAGLELPRLAVSFHDRDGCDGNLGSLGVAGGRYRLKTCAGGGALRQNLLHELAHAWDRSGGITDSTRSDFLAMRGLESWRDSDEAWSRRGAEHAAEIVAWGLEVAQWAIPSAVADVGPQSPDDLGRAFTLLTGRPPLWAR